MARGAEWLSADTPFWVASSEERELPEKEELSLKGWLAEILGEDAVDVCARCGAKGSLFLRGEYETFSKLTLFLVEVLGIVGSKVPVRGRA